MKKTNILLGITGGIAAYKACSIINGLDRTKYDIKVIMTENAQRFISPLSIETLCQNPVMTSMWSNNYKQVEHIEVSKWADLFVVAPATVNIIAKFANGIADDLLSTVYLALPDKTKKLIFPAANTNMIRHPSTVRNIQTLIKDGCFVYPTVTKRLACGDFGEGALLSVKEILEIINSIPYEVKEL